MQLIDGQRRLGGASARPPATTAAQRKYDTHRRASFGDRRRSAPCHPCPPLISAAAISPSIQGPRSHGRAPVHLSHAGPRQDLAGRQEGSRERQPLLLPRRQDRRARRQRLGQVDASAHHGGLDKEFVGEGFVAEGAKVGYLPQEPALDPALDVRGNAMLGVKEKQAILDRYNELAMNYSDETADEMTRLQDEIEAKGLGISTARSSWRWTRSAARRTIPTSTTLSGGERRRVALCRLLLEKPDLLLLDEPTNHLDAETVNWLEGHLRQYPGAILIVTHDRYFLDNVTGWILELDRGRGIPYEGNYSSWLKQKQKRLEQEGREDAARQRALAEESEWIASSPRARQAKSKARIAAYDELVRKSNEKAPTTAQIVIPVAERLGQNVIDFADLSKGYGDTAAHRQSHVQAAARRHRRRHRPQRRRQDDALSHDHRPGEAGLRARSRSANP